MRLSGLVKVAMQKTREGKLSWVYRYPAFSCRAGEGQTLSMEYVHDFRDGDFIWFTLSNGSKELAKEAFGTAAALGFYNEVSEGMPTQSAVDRAKNYFDQL